MMITARMARSTGAALLTAPLLWVAGVASAVVLGPGCAPKAEEQAETSRARVLAASRAANGDFVLPFHDASTLRSGGDWDSCRNKATCAVGETVVGLSAAPGGAPRMSLCHPAGNASYTGDVVATLNADGADARREQRAGDWAPGFTKLECGSSEYVSAVSQNAKECQGDRRFHALQCSRGPAFGGACRARTVDAGDDRGSTSSGDWDVGAYKAECGQGEALIGVSISPTTGRVHSILCCASAEVAAAPPAATAATADAFFAISPDEGSWSDAQARTLRGLGAGMVRLQFCDWPAARTELDRKLTIAANAGLSVLAEINYCTLPAPASAAERQALWHADFSDAGNAFATRFATAAGEIASAFAGRISRYEIWNEPDATPRPNDYPTAFYPSPGNADWAGACGAYDYGVDYGNGDWAICPKQLGVLTTNAFMAIKTADPRGQVVAGNLLFHGEDGWVAKEYWAEVEASPAVAWHKKNKGGVPWDTVGIHPYAYDPSSGRLQAQLASFRATMSAAGDGAKLALTEYGWGTSASTDKYLYASESDQAKYVGGTFAAARQAGVDFVMWFNYLSGGGLDFGLRRADMTWKPAGRAYCAAAGASACPAD